MIQAFAFYMFATVVIASGVLTILSRNPVHSVLWLILAFFNAAGLMVIIGAEFIAMLLILVYVGAVAVLFLFVVMMLNIDFASLRTGLARNLPFGLLIAAILLAEMILAVGAWSFADLGPDTRMATINPDVPNVEAIGRALYDRYLLVFEGAGIVLLIAMVGAIVLTHRERSGTRPQNVSQQIKRRPEDAVRKTNPEIGKGVEL
ncbi:NADH-quinone oxidoreductase subunit J [Parasphingopyxis sp. CP4]|uniref:NADH-quinone oxidoreductase subunit J n=1 Tax=Parasphingopyxis sp. CP4 TaxID=2724527 RepID=UPI0015A0B00F|nr:NADH-quinone oxidoreductase subunit J [Parasphingopyxis sp. CP4]QLC21685.1 NADH-quinone oxidoreductase subunit J [Parasphingopyxis sp. CP4]